VSERRPTNPAGRWWAGGRDERNDMNSTKPQFFTPQRRRRWLGFVLVLLVVGCVIWLAALPTQPFHPRRDALLRHLQAIASEVNAYRTRSGSFPQSLKAIPFVGARDARVPAGYCPYPDSGYQLIVRPNLRDFLIVADHVSTDEKGIHFRYACDGDLQIQKVPPTPDKRQGRAAPNQPGG
jgi:hypothetical protein